MDYYTFFEAQSFPDKIGQYLASLEAMRMVKGVKKQYNHTSNINNINNINR
jgi:hypothetical protein